MSIRELITIIKKEELHYYTCFKIGDPSENNPLAMSYAGGAEISGIYCNKNGDWKIYTIGERTYNRNEANIYRRKRL